MDSALLTGGASRDEGQEMEMRYYLFDGTEVAESDIRNAFESGKAVLVHGRAEGHSSTSLMLDGRHYDTRGECYSVWDEAWTRTPETLNEALRAARAISPA